VNEITSGGFSLRHVLERVGGIGIGNGGFRGSRFGQGRAQGKAMGQQLQTSRLGNWRSRQGQSRWLSVLIDTMEQVSRPEYRSLPCDRSVLAKVSAQLARPASPYLCASQYSLRN
jgi:hypothetical protein